MYIFFTFPLHLFCENGKMIGSLNVAYKLGIQLHTIWEKEILKWITLKRTRLQTKKTTKIRPSDEEPDHGQFRWMEYEGSVKLFEHYKAENGVSIINQPRRQWSSALLDEKHLTALDIIERVSGVSKQLATKKVNEAQLYRTNII